MFKLNGYPPYHFNKVLDKFNCPKVNDISKKSYNYDIYIN